MSNVEQGMSNVQGGELRGARAWGRGELNIEYRTRPSPFVATEGRQGISNEEVRGVARRAGVGRRGREPRISRIARMGRRGEGLRTLLRRQ